MQKIISYILLLFIIISCKDDHIIYTKYKSVNSNKWHKDAVVSFNFIAKDTLSKNNIYINLRNDKNYDFNNLFLIASVEFPNKTKITDTLEYQMTDQKGYFLGNGITDIKENKLEYKTKITFPIKGTYIFNIQHAMRKMGQVDGLIFLNGITDVGIEINKEKTND